MGCWPWTARRSTRNGSLRPALIYSSPYTRNLSRTVETTPILSGERVYFGASDGCLYAVNRQTGALEWRYSTGAPIFGSVSVVGNSLYTVDFGAMSPVSRACRSEPAAGRGYGPQWLCFIHKSYLTPIMCHSFKLYLSPTLP